MKSKEIWLYIANEGQYYVLIIGFSFQTIAMYFVFLFQIILCNGPSYFDLR